MNRFTSRSSEFLGSLGRWTRSSIALVLAVMVLAVTANADTGGQRHVSVMTRNLYIGSDLSPVMVLPPDAPPEALLGGVAMIYGNILAADFPKRAEALAAEIIVHRPDFVALQEVSLLRHQSPGDSILGGTSPATDIELDYLAILLEAIASKGGQYRVASQVENLDIELPLVTATPGVFDDIRLTDRDVILVRADLPPGQLRVQSSDQGNFALSMPLPIGIDVIRGWCSVDAFVRGRRFRLINAHPEIADFTPVFQYYQTLELLAGPANTDLPVILVGDFNSDANGGPMATDVYPLLTQGGGFDDAWTIVNPDDPGPTFGHDAYLSDPTIELDQRLDLILWRGERIRPTFVTVLDNIIDITAPLWVSDHAGVFCRFRLK